MTRLDPATREAVRTLRDRLADASIEWALTGSTSFALQGVPLDPDDVDVQTTEAGAYEIEVRFSDAVVDPVSVAESSTIRSHFGAFELDGVRVEVMGDLQKRVDGEWEPPVDVSAHREYVSLAGEPVPVLSLSYEAIAYDRLGRDERAELLREYA
ncbi:nucleotidyltransferase domain-containing protein [Halovivax limisalsi]|uniref:nucleotidyltransferase domain-containing protein n=1 Tax=Halovivax limisalsi TaxID=1453760 RepID=UPI001FFD74FD|nr:hypothetical protein [Halovivax limisalsi]